MRLLFVHAHPDDESIATGVSIGAYAADGHDVHVLTCTLGEQGEIIPPELAHLDADHEDRLADVRSEELSAAVAALGAVSHVLGADSTRRSRYRDSGMAGTPSAQHPDAFVGADPAEAVGLMRAVLDDIGPDVVVTYDARGGYDHPDHIQTHRITCAAVSTMATPPRLYAVVTPASWARADRDWVAANVAEAGIGIPDPAGEYPAGVVADDLVTHAVAGEEGLAAQRNALSAHRTQVRVWEGWFSLSNDLAQRLSGREGFARLDPATGLLLPRPTRVSGSASCEPDHA